MRKSVHAVWASTARAGVWVCSRGSDAVCFVLSAFVWVVKASLRFFAVALKNKLRWASFLLRFEYRALGFGDSVYVCA